MSTTLESKVAMGYAAGDGSRMGIVIEVQQGMVNRGADISWISQYPHEAEILFGPLTGIEARRTRIDGNVVVVECEFSINLTALTLEQVVGKRLKLLKDMSDGMAVEVAHAHGDAARDALRAKLLAPHTPASLPGPAAFSADWYNQSDVRFVHAVKEALHLKAQLGKDYAFAQLAFVRVGFLRDLVKDGLPLPSRNKVPPKELHVVAERGSPPAFKGVFGLVSCWQTRKHPDPKGEVLREFVEVLGRPAWEDGPRTAENDDLCFIDYISLTPPANELGEGADVQAAYERALEATDMRIFLDGTFQTVVSTRAPPDSETTFDQQPVPLACACCAAYAQPRRLLTCSSASGLRWKEAGTELPANGKELSNEKLSKALRSKVEFTAVEWEDFGINELQMDHCIRAGDKYFKPVTHEAVEPAEAVVLRTIAQLGAADEGKTEVVQMAAAADGSCLKPEVLQRVRDILDRLTPSVPSLHTDVAGFERLCIEGDLAWTKVEYIRHLVAQGHALLPYSQDLPDGAFYRGLPPMTARKFTISYVLYQDSNRGC